MNGITTIKAEELANAKAKLKGILFVLWKDLRPLLILQSTRLSKICQRIFYTNYLKSIDNVTIADAQNAAKTNILPNQSRIFIAGKAADISEGLEKLGYPVNYYDKDANKIEKPATKK